MARRLRAAAAATAEQAAAVQRVTRGAMADPGRPRRPMSARVWRAPAEGNSSPARELCPAHESGPWSSCANPPAVEHSCRMGRQVPPGLSMPPSRLVQCMLGAALLLLTIRERSSRSWHHPTSHHAMASKLSVVLRHPASACAIATATRYPPCSSKHTCMPTSLQMPVVGYRPPPAGVPRPSLGIRRAYTGNIGSLLKGKVGLKCRRFACDAL